MPLVKTVRKRGATMVIEANAELLWTPTGPMGRFANRFSQRLRAFAQAEAPSNKRPRWGHYGAPLKTTFTASTDYDPARMRVDTVVGSKAPYSAYVDQGTGIYAGRAPYLAKILPPWTRGGNTLYEATWIPPGSSRSVRPVFIKGQKGQFFLDAAMKRAFQSMRLRAFQVPGDPRIAAQFNSFPDRLVNQFGNTPNTPAFRASLTEWRAWRDRSFNMGRVLGRNSGFGTREMTRRLSIARDRRQARNALRASNAKRAAERRREDNARRAREYRRRQKEAKSFSKDAQTKANRKKDMAAERARFLSAMVKKYGSSNVETESLERRGGYYYITVRVLDERGRYMFKEVRGKSQF